jgi:hypothetical protein
MSEWISVKERLPPLEEFVVVASNVWDGPRIVYFGERKLEHANIDAYFMCSRPRLFLKVLDVATHWMPLPELPKEEK